MKKALVTGADGFIGRRLVRKLKEDGWAVHPLRNDIRDGMNVRNQLEEADPDWVFHLAAYGNSPDEEDVELIYDTNVNGTAILVGAINERSVDHAINSGRIVFASSSSVYGDRDTRMCETDMPRPNSDYAISKLCAEQMVVRHGGTALRLFSVFGPGEAGYRLIPTLRRQIVAWQESEIAADCYRDFIHVDDVVRAFLHFAGHGGVLNIGSGHQTAILDMYQHMCSIVHKAPNFRWISSPRTWESRMWEADISRASSRGWLPSELTYKSTGLREYMEKGDEA